MPFAAALSTCSDTSAAIAEVCSRALESLQSPTTELAPQLALLFFSLDHAGRMERGAADLRKRLNASCLLGCCGDGIVGNDQEIEQGPAMSLWLARWAKPATIEPFRLTFSQAGNAVQIQGMPESISTADVQRSAILLFADPHSFRADYFLSPINQNFQGLPVMGGLATGRNTSAGGKLLLGDAMHEQGAVGVLLSGSCEVRGIVSHSCRPVGKPLAVTRANGNIIHELNGRPPLALMHQLFQQLSLPDQQLFQRGLHIGRPTIEGEYQVPSCDFLVRNMIGMDRGSGSVTIDGRFSVGQTVQFLLRDADTADDNLRTLLQRELRGSAPKPGGALLFTCNRRGSRFFGKPNHDAGALRAELGNLPVAGLFTPGEIGPVAGQNYVHGYTASIALFGG